MPVINKPNQHFDVTTYTGTGSAGQVQTNSGSMQPDLVWIKNRSSTGGHWWSDSIRGAANYLSSQNTDAEASSATGVSSFNSNGFTHGTDSWTGGNGATYVAWQWKAASANTIENLTVKFPSLEEAQSHLPGREDVQGKPQEIVRIDTSKLDPAHYTFTPGPGAHDWVKFKFAAPEQVISPAGAGATKVQ